MQDRCFDCRIKKGNYTEDRDTFPAMKFFLLDGQEYCENCFVQKIAKRSPQFRGVFNGQRL